jgi:hypothetical protein
MLIMTILLVALLVVGLVTLQSDSVGTDYTNRCCDDHTDCDQCPYNNGSDSFEYQNTDPSETPDPNTCIVCGGTTLMPVQTKDGVNGYDCCYIGPKLM